MEPQQYPLHDVDQQPQNVDNPLAVMQPGERVICEIRRHPIGTLGIYSTAAIIVGVLLACAILAPIYLTFLTTEQKVAIVIGVGLAILLTLIFAYIAVYVYQANRWIVTSDSITQITQVSLFDRHSNQLSLANLEDVSAEQHSLLEQLLGYGELELETAGAERGKFKFPYCPNPTETARKIIAAHEEFMQGASAEIMSKAHESVMTLPGSHPNPYINDQQQGPPAGGQGPSASY